MVSVFACNSMFGSCSWFSRVVFLPAAMDPTKVFDLFSGIRLCFRLIYSLARLPAPRELFARTTTLYSRLGCNPIMLKDSLRAFMISGNGGLCGRQSIV